MANESTDNRDSGKAGNDFRAASAPGQRGMKPIAAFLSGMLLLAFSGVANVDTVYAHSGPTPPSSEDLAELEIYKDATSLLVLGHQNMTGLHKLAQTGALGMLKPEIVKDLRPEHLGLLDGPKFIRERDKTGNMVEKPNPNRRSVAALLVASRSARYMSKEMQGLFFAYSETLDAAGQRKLASDAVDSEILDLVSISKLTPGDLVQTIVTHVPTDNQGGSREVKSNLLLDALRNRQTTLQLKALVDNITPAQMDVAAKAVDEFGGTLAHYWAQDGNVKMLVKWKDKLDWSAPDVTVAKVTALGILAKNPQAFSSVFGADDALLAAALAHPANREAREQLVISHKILEHSKDILNAVLTPELLLGTSVSGDGPLVAKLKPECLVAYFSAPVMGEWTPEQRKSVWANVNPDYKHIPEVRQAYYGLMTAAQPPTVPGPLANALN